MYTFVITAFFLGYGFLGSGASADRSRRIRPPSKGASNEQTDCS
jgi:hypothetical protein